MRKRVLSFIAACFYYSGLVKLARWWTWRSGPHLVILIYHRATGGYLRRHYRMLYLEAALEELYTPLRRGKRNRRIPLVLTFDDGYHDNYTHGFALAHKLQVPLTINLIPSYIETGGYFWWLEDNRLVHRAQVNETTIGDRTYHLGKSDERRALAQATDSRLRQAKSVAEHEEFLATVGEELSTRSSIAVDEESVRPLTWAEVREMEESGWVSFGAHTMHHPNLANLTDREEVKREVGECCVVLEQQLGHPVCTFAYPIGQLTHIGDDVLHAVQQAGYNWAVTTMDGFNTPRSNPYLLRRVEVDVSQHRLVIAAETAGLWGFFSRLRWIPIVRKHFTNASQR